LMTGFQEVDEVIGSEGLVEFYSTDGELLSLFYHRVIALSAPVDVVLVGERGGLDSLLLRRLQRTFRNRGEVYLRRAFKAEDVAPTIRAMEGEEVVVVDPYHHFKGYSQIVGAMRGREGREFVFSLMDRERRGSVFGLHSAHSIFKLEDRGRGFKVKLIKSPTRGEVEFSYGKWEIYGRYERGLLRWIH